MKKLNSEIMKFWIKAGVIIKSFSFSKNSNSYPVPMNIVDSSWLDNTMKGDVEYMGEFTDGVTPIWR